jgi:hypothetical protein
MKKSKWMTGFVTLVMILSAFAFVGCDALGIGGKDDDNNTPTPPTPPVEEDTGIDYQNYLTNFSVKVKNDSNNKLVAFKGSPSASTYISGVPIGGGEHGLKRDSALFATTGDFVLFLVTEEDYLANKANLGSLSNKPFTRIYAYYNANAENKLTYNISSILGGTKKIILQNNTSFNVELRRDGVQGELIGYAGTGTYNTTFNVEAADYMVFPVFRKFNAARGEIITVYPKYQGGNLDGKAKFQYFSLDDSMNEATLNASEFVGEGIVLKTGSAYLVVTNNHGTGMTLLDGLQVVTTSTGGQVVNPNNTLTFQIDMTKKPGSTDEYLESSTKAQFKVGTPAYYQPVPSFIFESDKIYSIDITGANPGDINLSTITEIGTMSFNDL